MSKVINNEMLMEYFFQEPDRLFHVRELARLTKLHPSSISKYLLKLSSEHLLDQKRELHHLLFRANAENPLFKEKKRHYNFMHLYHSGLITYVERELHYPAIIIFGSYARGENRANSDIDIFIITERKKELQLIPFEKKMKQ